MLIYRENHKIMFRFDYWIGMYQEVYIIHFRLFCIFFNITCSLSIKFGIETELEHEKMVSKPFRKLTFNV